MPNDRQEEADRTDDHNLLIRIDERVANLICEVDEIKTNHLEHIYNRLGSIENKMAYYIGGIAVVVVIINVLIKLVLK